MNETYQIETSKYRLQLGYSSKYKNIIFLFYPKVNNKPFKIYVTNFLDHSISKGQMFKLFQKFRKYRLLSIQPEELTISFNQEKLLFLKDKTEFFSNQLEAKNKQLNYGVLYWGRRKGLNQFKNVLDLRNKMAYFNFLSRQNKGEYIMNEKVYLCESQSSKMIQQKPFKIIKKKEKASQKILLFRHIFLTQILARMILTKFGRSKRKTKIKGKIMYKDQELAELRSYGYRLSEFGGTSLEKFHKHKKQKNQVKQYHQKAINQRIQKFIKEPEQISNFTLISGQQKTKINKMRLCLHQMTQESDKTIGMINFVKFSFDIIGKEELLTQRNSMKNLMRKIKVKKCLKSYLHEYSNTTFFHEIINAGLRIMKAPQDLSKLQIPFTNIFWCIRFLYCRHKRALFQQGSEKNKNRVIKLYRGCQMSHEQIKILKKNIQGYIELEGFLSTSSDQTIADNFTVNVILNIEVPASNLNGVFDNGMANISYFSTQPIEKEILINAFNVFQIKKIKSPTLDQKQYHVYLEYGSIKLVEEKVKMSEEKLEKDFLLKLRQNDIKQLKICLKSDLFSCEQKTKEKILIQLVNEQKKLKNWKSSFQKEIQEQYKESLGKLGKWECELIRNSIHQEEKIKNIENYGQLLYEIDEYEMASTYFSEKMKKLQSYKAMEGIFWRNSRCLVEKMQKCRFIQYNSKFMRGDIEGSLQSMKELLTIYKSISLQEQKPRFYTLLYHIYRAHHGVIGQEQKKEQYKKKLLDIMHKNKLTQTWVYQSLMELDKVEQDKKQVSKVVLAQKAEEKIDKMIEIRKYGAGKFSAEYLHTLYQLITLRYKQKKWKLVLKSGKYYFQVRNQKPKVEPRILSCWILQYMINICAEKRWKEQFQQTCSLFRQFFESSINNRYEFHLIFMTLFNSLRMNLVKAGRIVVHKLTQLRVKCKILENDVYLMMLYGYVTLLLNVSDDDKVNDFLGFTQNMFKDLDYKNTAFYKNMVLHIFDYNFDIKDIFDERYKDYEDVKIIEFVKKTVKKDEISEWYEFEWMQRIAHLLPYQKPLYPFGINRRKAQEGIQKHFMKGEFFQQFLNSTYKVHYEKEDTQFYLCKLLTSISLHLTHHQKNKIPQLLQLWSVTIPEVYLLQNQYFNIDLKEVIERMQHLRDDVLTIISHTVVCFKSLISLRRPGIRLDMKNLSARRMTKIFDKFAVYEKDRKKMEILFDSQKTANIELRKKLNQKNFERLKLRNLMIH